MSTPAFPAPSLSLTPPSSYPLAPFPFFRPLRVSSPQHDWFQGTIALTPGVPRLLTLEVSYLLPVPAWFLHPAALDDTTGRLVLDLSCGFGSYVTDPRFADANSSHSSGSSGGSTGASGLGGSCSGGGLERLELCGQLAWRPSRVASFFNRLLPCKGQGSSKAAGGRPTSPRYGGTSPRFGNGPRLEAAASESVNSAGAGGGGSGSGGVSVRGCVGVGYSRQGGAGGGAVASPPPPSSTTHLLGVSKVAVWQVPADTEWRFAEGFLFTAEDHKAEQLLAQYNLLQ